MDEQTVEIMTHELGAVPTRVIVVEEMIACGLISKKKGRKRIGKIMEGFQLPAIPDDVPRPSIPPTQ